MMRASERFMKYILFDTASDPNSPCCPSTEKQWALANALVDEMRGMGIADAHADEHGYVYGSIPANIEDAPAIGLIAHMDVSDSAPCAPMNARVIENYDGGPVELSPGIVLDPAVTRDLAGAKGKSLIVTDGHTLLGADDKAGIAEIMAACERVLNDPAILHGKICIGFTPDEEIGRGADLFDVKGFGADFAYTVDGGPVGSVSFENFNAASGDVTVHGVSFHPGDAKNKLKNPILIAMEFLSMLPAPERPEHTEGYEGFFHVHSFRGAEEQATFSCLIRDHDRTRFEDRKAMFTRIADFLNAKYGEGTVEATVKDSYFNMREVVEKNMSIVERAERAFREAGVMPWHEPVRGGTDGSRLSFEGLPCPNLSTGGMNGHGRFECIAAEDLEIMTEVLVNLVRAQI